MRHLVVSVLAFFSLFVFSSLVTANDLDQLFKQVETLKLERQGYVLGAKLNKEQLTIATANPEKAAAQDTFKFRDEHLFVVAHSFSNRVILMYEQFEDVDRQKIQGLVGDLYIAFDDPTVMSHDKNIYWAWSEKGKISSEQFYTAKKEKKKLNILATVKCISDIEIMANKKDMTTGDVYYVIASDAILTFLLIRKAKGSLKNNW